MKKTKMGNLYIEPQAVPGLVVAVSAAQQKVAQLEELLTRAAAALQLAGGNAALVAEINAALSA